MGETTHIEWADASFSPWFGCTKVSIGPKGACEGCYAEHLTVNRFKKAGWGPHAERVRSAESTWKQPLAWDRRAAREGTRPFVFCSHLSDVFDNQVPPEWRRDLFDLIRATPNLTWLLLTKRPQNIPKLFAETITPELRAAQTPDRLGRSLWPRNAAIGFTAVTQAEIDRDAKHALAAYRGLHPAFLFCSGEPLMEAMVIPPELLALAGRFWMIAGGMTSQGKFPARPTPDGAFESLRDQCAAAGVPFLFKQHGEHLNGVRVGKKAAGRLLDGREHNERPGGNNP